MNGYNTVVIVAAALIWGFAACYIFAFESLKSYLIRFRYRELRNDLESERLALALLFSVVDEPSRYKKVFSPIDHATACAWTGICSCVLLFSFGMDPAGLGHGEVMAVYLSALVLVSIVQGFFLVCAARAFGPRLGVLFLKILTVHILIASVLLTPLRALVEAVASKVKLTGAGWKPDPTPVDRDLQILASGREDVRFTPVTEKIAIRSLELSSIIVYDILLPRNQVQIFDVEQPNSVNIDSARVTGHTRFPLCKGDLDECFGIIHIKDLFRSPKDAAEIDLTTIARPTVRFDQYQPIDKVLQVLLQRRMHMALVQDDFGGILGVVTLERILEELVGEIQDEFDKEDKMILEIRKNQYKISGLTPVHEVEDHLGVDNLESEEVSSFGGLITHHLGRIPPRGEVVEIGPLVIQILDTDDTRVISANVRKRGT